MYDVYDEPDNFLYCPINKAASTKWYQNLMILWINKTASNFTKCTKHVKTMLFFFQQRHYPHDDVTYYEWHRKIYLAYPRIKNHTELLQGKNPTKFVIVRHPFYRLVSAYRSKFEKIHVTMKQ